MSWLGPQSQSQAVRHLPGLSPQPLTLTHSSQLAPSQQQAIRKTESPYFSGFAVCERLLHGTSEKIHHE